MEDQVVSVMVLPWFELKRKQGGHDVNQQDFVSVMVLPWFELKRHEDVGDP